MSDRSKHRSSTEELDARLPRESKSRADESRSSKEDKKQRKGHPERTQVVSKETDKSKDRHDKSPQEKHVSSRAHVDGAEGVTRSTPVDNPLPGPSTGDPSSGPSISELYGMMNVVIAKINSMETARAGHRDHELSDSNSDDESSGDANEDDDDDRDDDPLDRLTAVISGSPDPDGMSAPCDFTQALQDIAGFFQSDEEKGTPLSAELAGIMNDSLRHKPNDSSVKATAAKLKFPSNVPNFKVPITNEDVSKALSNDGKLLDSQLFRTNGLLLRALVPVVSMIDDIGRKKQNPLPYYLEQLKDTLRLIAAAFNYLNQARKEVIRTSVRENGLPQLCRWDCAVGTDTLFPFDVTKRCDELGKVRKLGHRTKRFRKSFGHEFKSSGNYNSQKWSRNRYDSRSAPYSTTKGKGTKAFLGQKKTYNNDRNKGKRY